jgi:hypothetical protein
VARHAAPYYVLEVFLNLTNHPSDHWPAAQRTQAESLAGEIVDEPFPDVLPDAGPAQVAAIGQSVLQRVVGRAPAAVLVQGEFTLTCYLVQQLQSRGIPCYAATTRRIVETAAIPGGSDKKSRFEFVQFRRYCSPFGASKQDITL